MSAPPCASDPWLWHSTLPQDHVEAKKGCKSCPIITDCAAIVAKQKYPEGTWAGRLFGAGSRKRKTLERLENSA